MYVWGPTDQWIISIQSNHTCFGPILGIKNWKTLRELPPLPDVVLTEFVKVNKFNPFVADIKNAQLLHNVKKQKSIRQAVEYYVQDVKTYMSESENSKWILRSSVHASMKNTLYSNLIVITVTDSTVEIIDAACQCPAGLGKACTHVCAVFFFWHLFKEEYFCPTNQENQWKIPNVNTRGKRISDVIFRKHGFNKKHIPDSNYQPCENYFDPRPADLVSPSDKKRELLKKLVDEILKSQPNSLFNLFHGVHTGMIGAPDLANNNPQASVEVRKDVLGLIDLYHQYRSEEANQNFVDYARAYYVQKTEEVNESTIEQSGSMLWKTLRFGLPTASVAHQLYTRVNSFNRPSNMLTDVQDPRGGLKKLFETMGIQTPSMLNGILMENRIRNFYLDLKKEEHTGCSIEKKGLRYYDERGLIGASVDGIFFCDAEDPRLLEIKCVSKLAGHKCITKLDTLNVNHSYYTQVQVGMGIYKLEKCDFIIYESEINYKIIEVTFDRRRFLDTVANCEYFFKNFVVPFLANPTEIESLHVKQY